jgi:transposase
MQTDSKTGVIAGIDVHKKMLAVVVARADAPDKPLQEARFGASMGELGKLSEWLQQLEVTDVVMESTAKYWKPVWMALESSFRLHLAQAMSNRAPRGRKTDFGDCRRLVRRWVAGDLRLSYVPEGEQRKWRLLTHTRLQYVRQVVRLRNQMEGVLEEAGIKLSGIVSDLLGMSGLRILDALAGGQTDAAALAALGDDRLRVSKAALEDALRGRVEAEHQLLLRQHLEQVRELTRQIQELDAAIGASLHQHAEAVERLCEVPGIAVTAAEQIIAEIGPQAAAFDSPEQMASWIGVCPGRQESGGDSHSNRSPKGNRTMRSVLTQVAWAAVRTRESRWRGLFTRWVSRLGPQKAIWAVAHRMARLIWKLLHQGVRYLERELFQLRPEVVARRKQRLLRELRKLGYEVALQPSLLSGPAPVAR